MDLKVYQMLTRSELVPLGLKWHLLIYLVFKTVELHPHIKKTIMKCAGFSRTLLKLLFK